MNRRLAGLGLVAVVAVVALFAAFRTEPPPRPNVLFVTFDATRADRMGFLGDTAAVTPMLDAMAARGTVFEEAITVQPLTLPSHTSLLTGFYPDRHGVRNNGTYVVAPEVVTLAERLSDVGYATHAVVSAFVLDSRFGLDQGFQGYDDDLSGGPQQKMFMFKEVPAADTTQRAIRWLRTPRATGQPFFLWVHFFDPHADYTPPSDVVAPDAYRGEIAYADRELGRILGELDAMGLLDDTLFVFASDHGESLGEHGESTHGIFVYDATARVPLLLAGRGIPVGGRVRDVVRTVDVVPTVLTLLGLPGASDLDGRTLTDVWDGDESPRTAYIEAMSPRLNFGWSELRAMRSDRYKAIDAPRPELYDLDLDPEERVSQAPATGPLFDALAARKATDPFYAGAQGPSAMDAATREQLEALGYVWVESAAGDGPRADPKDRLPYWTRFQRGQDLIRQARYPDAIDALRALLLEDPGNITAKGSFALALARDGRTDESLATYAEMIAMEPARDTPYLASMRMLREAGRLDEAHALGERLWALQPRNAEAAAALGDVWTERGDLVTAERWFRDALALDPHAASASAGLGNALHRAGRSEEARRVLVDALDHTPDDHALTYNLAVVSDQTGDQKGALGLYERAVRLDPNHAMSHNNLGTVLEKLGRHAEAVAAVETAHQVDPLCIEATYNLGALRLADGRLAEAAVLLADAHARDPGMVPAAVLLGDVLVRTGDLDGGIAVWESVRADWPDIDSAITDARRSSRRP